MSEKKTETLFYALGGLEEVGKNTFCVEHGDNILIIDAGVMFPEQGILGVNYVIPDYTHLKNNRSILEISNPMSGLKSGENKKF